jgi:hypothetical protein
MAGRFGAGATVVARDPGFADALPRRPGDRTVEEGRPPLVVDGQGDEREPDRGDEAE